MTNDNPKTISVTEAGKLLGIGKNSAYQAAACGQIPVIKIGKLLRVPRAALENMLGTTVKQTSGE